jgi:hypothetical protein
MFVGKKVTLIEIGVYGGGSLELWRKFLGPAARIIGIDLNPQAKELETQGFEIYIGDQEDPEFWKATLGEIGKFDILIDDGGHTTSQQWITLLCCINHANQNAVLLFEDTFTSYMKFGHFRKFSFVERTQKLIPTLYRQYHGLRLKTLSFESLKSISYYPGIVSFRVGLASKITQITNSPSYHNQDFRHHEDGKFVSILWKLYHFVSLDRAYERSKYSQKQFVYAFLFLLSSTLRLFPYFVLCSLNYFKLELNNRSLKRIIP